MQIAIFNQHTFLLSSITKKRYILCFLNNFVYAFQSTTQNIVHAPHLASTQFPIKQFEKKRRIFLNFRQKYFSLKAVKEIKHFCYRFCGNFHAIYRLHYAKVIIFLSYSQLDALQLTQIDCIICANKIFTFCGNCVPNSFHNIQFNELKEKSGPFIRVESPQRQHSFPLSISYFPLCLYWKQIKDTIETGCNVVRPFQKQDPWKWHRRKQRSGIEDPSRQHI